MFTITKQFSFSASHRLADLPESHPCSHIHGHNYEVVVELASEDLDNGFVVDYRALSPIKQYLATTLDHRHLNDALPFPPTAENIARHLYETFKPVFPQLIAVRVSETPKTWAEYRVRQ